MALENMFFPVHSLLFILFIARDWLIHFMLIRMIIFPFTYWRRYRYEVDKDGWSVRKRRNRRAPLSCECKMKIIPWQCFTAMFLQCFFKRNHFYRNTSICMPCYQCSSSLRMPIHYPFISQIIY